MRSGSRFADLEPQGSSSMASRGWSIMRDV
jgi:hypothetical protein